MAKTLLVEIDRPYKTLNEISNYKVLYSLTLEVLGYTGHAIIVRNDSLVSKKIYFKLNGYLDTETLLDHCGSGDGIVTNIGDQKMFGDATQSNPSYCAKIVIAGDLQTENGYPCLVFDNVDDHYDLPFAVSAKTAAVSLFAWVTPTLGNATNDWIIGSNASSSGSHLIVNSSDKPAALTYRTATNTTSAITAATGTHLFSSTADKTNLDIYIDGVLDKSEADDNTDFTTATYNTIGGVGASGSVFGGTLQFIGIVHDDEADNMLETYTELSQRLGVATDYVPTINIASESWVSASNSVNPNAEYKGDILDTISIKKKIGFFAHNNEFDISISDLNIDNSSGDYDFLLTERVKNLPVKLKLIDSDDTDYSNAVQIASYIIQEFDNDDDFSINGHMVSKISFADKNTNNQYFSSTLTFTGNQEQPQGFAIGTVYQVPIQQVNHTTNIYQLTSESDVDNVIGVSDRSDPLVDPTDYVELSMTESDGYGVDLANPPSGTITADYVADDFNSVSSNTFEGFVGKALIEYGGLCESDVDFASAAAIDTLLSYEYGLYISTGTNVKTIIEALCASSCGFHYQLNNGKIAFDVLKDPAVSAVDEFTSIGLASGVKVSTDHAPSLSDAASSRKNNHVFSYDEIIDIGHSEALNKTYTDSFRFNKRATATIAKSGTFAETYLQARNGDYIETILSDETSLDGYLVQLADLYPQQRYFYEFDYLIDDVFGKGSIDLNDTIELIHDRYGLDDGKMLRVVELEIKNVQENELTIKGWG